MELLFIGLALGSVIAYFIFLKFNISRKKRKINTQSVILIERIRSVCKFITVEGDFSEIYHYENMQQKWLNLLLGKKKALVLIEARAYVGFDLIIHSATDNAPFAKPFLPCAIFRSIMCDECLHFYAVRLFIPMRISIKTYNVIKVFPKTHSTIWVSCT